MLIKVRLIVSYRDWETRTLSFSMITLQKEEKHCERFTSERGRERIYYGKFSKVKALSRGEGV